MQSARPQYASRGGGKNSRSDAAALHPLNGCTEEGGGRTPQKRVCATMNSVLKNVQSGLELS
jgi:hypothetical protein